MNGSILAAIGAHIGYAVGDIFVTKTAKKAGGANAAFWVNAFGLLFVIPLVFFFDFSGVSISMIGIIFLLAVLSNLVYVGFTKALEIGNPSLVGAIAGAFPAITVVLSVIFYHETLNHSQVLAVAVTIIGVVLSSVNIAGLLKTRHKLKVDKSVGLAIFAFLGWGVYFTFIREPVEAIGWFWTNTIVLIFSIVILYVMLRKNISNVTKDKSTAKYAIPAAILVTGATFMVNLAIENGQSSIVAPIVGSYPALFVLLAYFVFKEKLNKQQIAGVVITLVGVVAITVVA